MPIGRQRSRARARPGRKTSAWDNLERKRVVVVGDAEVGKTSLLLAFSRAVIPMEYVPTVSATSISTIQVEAEDKVELVLYDTAGQEQFDRLRQLSYPTADVILICFSVDSPDSFQNVIQKWNPEIAHFCLNVPVILVGSKVDVRTDKLVLKAMAEKGIKPVSTIDGFALADKIKAFFYVECSTKANSGVIEVFETAARAAALCRPSAARRKRQCVIL